MDFDLQLTVVEFIHMFYYEGSSMNVVILVINNFVSIVLSHQSVNGKMGGLKCVKLPDVIYRRPLKHYVQIDCTFLISVTVQSPKLKKLFFSAGTESHYRTFSSNPMQSESPSREVKIGDRVELRCTFKVQHKKWLEPQAKPTCQILFPNP